MHPACQSYRKPPFWTPGGLHATPVSWPHYAPIVLISLLSIVACNGSLVDFFGGGSDGDGSDTSVEETGDPVDTEDTDDADADDALVRALTNLPEGNYPCREPVLVRIAYITDGDTVYVHPDETGDGFKVRLIGIDTPEIEHEGEPADCYGAEATAFTSDQVKDKLAWLTFDAECEDYYDRTLAYAIRGEGEDGFFNRVLARQGYAEQLTIEPNSTFADDFADDIRAAQDDNLGIWKECR